MAPPFMMIVAASGTINTLYPNYCKSCEIEAIMVVLPAQGPPVNRIRVTLTVLSRVSLLPRLLMADPVLVYAPAPSCYCIYLIGDEDSSNKFAYDIFAPAFLGDCDEAATPPSYLVISFKSRLFKTS
jgi:hypothetical protein